MPLLSHRARKAHVCFITLEFLALGTNWVVSAVLETEPVGYFPVAILPNDDPVPAITAPVVRVTSLDDAMFLVAEAGSDTIDVYDAPEGDVAQTLIRDQVTHHLENPIRFLVIERQGDWVHVVLPVKPNGSTGWVRQSDVTLSALDKSITIDLSDRTLCVTEWYERIGVTAYCFPVAIGRPDAPTPTGDFFIEERLELTTDTVYGSHQLVLSAFSNTEVTFLGGKGQIGIHGTDTPALIGEEVSSGCIRLNNAHIAFIVNELGVLAGTPVHIQQ